MLNRRITILAILFVGILTVSAVNATENDVADIEIQHDDVLGKVNVDLTSDVNDNVLKANPKTFSDLNWTINGNDDSDVYLDGDYTFEIGSDSNFTDGVSINRAVTVHGNGYTIDANNAARIFTVSNRNIVFKDIIFVNGAADGNGGAINGKSTAVNCTFIANSATADGGAMYYCAAVNCTFINNSAVNYGGGAMCGGSAVNSTFTDNSAKYGGAVSSCSAVNCSFTNNFATSNGGAMSGKGCSAVNCSFIGNSVKDYGGAMAYVSSSVNCTFINNSAVNYGGAIYDGSAVRSIFIGNSAVRYGGGAIFSGAADNCSFLDNHASSNGGAVRGCSAVNCIFKYNSARDYGGAMYDGSADCCIFSENTAGISGDDVYETELIRPVLNVLNFTSTYNSGEKLIISFTDSNGTQITGANVSIDIYRNNDFLATYYCLSDEGWIVDLDAGSYSADVNVPGYLIDPVEATLEISKAQTRIVSSDVTASYNDKSKLVAALKDDKGKAIRGVYVDVSLGGADYSLKTSSKGQIQVFTAGLVPDTYVAYISFEGNQNYNKSDATQNVVVNKLDMILTVPDAAAVYNGGGSVVATLKDVNGKAVNNINVKITVGSLAKTLKTDSKGQVSLDFSSLNPGNYQVYVKSATSDIYNRASPVSAAAVVYADKLDTVLDVPDAFVINNSGGCVVATLKDICGNPVVGVNVKITVGSLAKTLKTDSDGKVSLDISSLSAGNYAVFVKSATTQIYNRATADASAIVSDGKIDTVLEVPNVVAFQGSGNVVATFKDIYGNVIRGVNVKITVGSLAKTLKTDDNGQVALDISSLAAGSYAVNVKTATTDIYNRATAVATLNLVSDKVETILTAEDVTTAHESGGKIVAALKDVYGNVLVGVNVKITVGSLAKTLKTDEKGQVSLDVSTLPVGSYTATIKSASTDIYRNASPITAKVRIV